MNDKKPLVSSEEYGKDEDTAETLIKKHEVIQKDIIGICVCVCMCVCACVCVCVCALMFVSCVQLSKKSITCISPQQVCVSKL